MKIALGAQGSAFAHKEAIKKALIEHGDEVYDVGQQHAEDTFFFVDSVENVAEKIKSGACELGIVMCGTGAGVSLLANKIPGIYCVACESVFMAERIYPFNGANVMAMGAFCVTPQIACEMAVKYVESVAKGAGSTEHVKNMEVKYFK